MNTRKRYLRTDSEIRSIVQAEVEKQTENITERIARDIAYQTMAVVFMKLHSEYGFGGKRLKALKDSIELEYHAMGVGVLGHTYSPEDAIKNCKDMFGIDFDESIFGGDSNE